MSFTPSERELITASNSLSKCPVSILWTNDSFRKSSGCFTVKESSSLINFPDVIGCKLYPSLKNIVNKYISLN